MCLIAPVDLRNKGYRCITGVIIPSPSPHCLGRCQEIEPSRGSPGSLLSTTRTKRGMGKGAGDLTIGEPMGWDVRAALSIPCWFRGSRVWFQKSEDKRNYVRQHGVFVCFVCFIALHIHNFPRCASVYQHLSHNRGTQRRAAMVESTSKSPAPPHLIFLFLHAGWPL